MDIGTPGQCAGSGGGGTVNRPLRILLLALSGVTTAQADEPLGRLFYTPLQRSQIDRLQPFHAVEGAESPAAPQPLALHGVVRRADGKTTVWLNQQMNAADPAAGQLPARSWVPIPGGGLARLMVGERWLQPTGRLPAPVVVMPDALPGVVAKKPID